MVRKGTKMSQASRDKMRLAKLRHPTNYWLGKHRPAETRMKISDTLKRLGLRPPPPKPEHIVHLLAWSKTHRHPMLGTHISEATKAKIRANRKMVWTDEGKAKLRHARLLQVFPVKRTRIELLAQESLLRRGIPFLANAPVEGRFQPDIRLADSKILVFCDGCYWHGCSIHCTGQVRQAGKITAEQKRNLDTKITRYLESRRWTVIRVWEHQFDSDPDIVGKLIEAAIPTALTRLK